MRLTLDNADREFAKILAFYKQELNSIHAGRANPSLVEDIEVSVYGQKMQIKQLATINIADASLIIVQPWDKSNLNQIKQGIIDAEKGLNPQMDGEVVRVPIPTMTEERRKEYIKIMKQKTEEARISVRQIRKEILDNYDEEFKAGDLSEDEHKRLEKLLQQKVDEMNEEIASLAEEKEQDLLKV